MAKVPKGVGKALNRIDRTIEQHTAEEKFEKAVSAWKSTSEPKKKLEKQRDMLDAFREAKAVNAKVKLPMGATRLR